MVILQEYKVLVNRIECFDINKKYVKEVECYRSATNQTTQVLHGYVQLISGIELHHIFARFQTFYKFNTEYKPIFGDIFENFCGYVNKTTPAPIISMAWGYIMTKSNANHTCPYTVGFIIFCYKILKVIKELFQNNNI